MPCHDTSTFPAFPPDIELDTLHFHQALSEHNLARSEADLPVANFLELSAAERHDVLDRAQKIKAAQRYNAIYLEKELEREQRRLDERLLLALPRITEPPEMPQFDLSRKPGMLRSLGSFLFFVGIVGLFVLLLIKLS
jgi:ribosome-binding ATPase YchF (GTP1/OBG family)